MLHLPFERVGSRFAAALLAMSVVIGQCLPAQADAISGNLNLASTRKTATAPSSITAPVTILNGNKAQTVTAGISLTPAQAVAVNQILTTGTQSLILGALGQAKHGSLTLQSGGTLSSLFVPRGVTLIGDFSSGSTLNLTGNLTNSGTIYAASNNQAISNAIFSANNIRNNAGGLITTIVPTGGLVGFTTPVTNLSLSLVAVYDIINAGHIFSANHLNLVAGHQIVNVAGSQAVMSAVNSVNIATPLLINGGAIQAGTNINIAEQFIHNAQLAALATQFGATGPFSTLSNISNLLIDNTGGSLKALNGAINFDHANAMNGVLLSVVGGDLLSQVVNADAGTGTLNINVDKMTGVLNTHAGNATVGASTPTLTLGTTNISGDPTFFNDNGNIDINGNLSVSDGLAIFASGII